MEYDFANDRRLGYDEAGMLLHILQNMSQPATTEWLMDRSPAGRDKVRKLMATLVQHEYVKIERTVGQPQRVFVRACLLHEWKLTGSKQAQSRKPKVQKLLVEAPVEAVISLAVTNSETAIDGELMETEAAIMSLKTVKKKVPLTERAAADPNFKLLVAAYRKMLKAKNLSRNLGEVLAAAREYGKLYPLIDSQPGVFTLMIEGMKAYSMMCGQYPVALRRYISEKLWVTAMEEAEENTIDWEKIDDEIDGGDF
jgi:hypothetical protein